jgi:hypothetical protein
MKTKRIKPGGARLQHPYLEYESDPLWPLLDKGISDLVANGDLIEQTERAYVVGYLCKGVLYGRKKTKALVK